MQSSIRSDRELIAACLAGDAVAWDALIERYQGFIFALSLRHGLTAADADDLFQDVCLKLYRHLGELRDARRLSSWLGAVVRQEIWGRWRRRRPLLMSELPEEERLRLDAAWEAQTDADPEEAVLALEREQQVRVSLESLGEECRHLLAMLYGPEPLGYAETAERLEMPLGSVGPRRARCLARLKKKLEELGY
jgi:RNA polymerase sigma factor (sigma-70 family)